MMLTSTMADNMHDPDNPMVTGLAAHYKRQDRADAALAEARVALYEELYAALRDDPARQVSTVGHGPRQRTAAAYEVLLDAFSGSSGDKLAIEACRIIGLAAQGKEAQARAVWLLDKVCMEHAAFHADDAAADHE